MTQPQTSPSDPQRLGVVSFAHAHVNAYLSTIAGFDDAVAVAAWDDDPERGMEGCERYGLAYEPDLGGLLARDDIDAVFVTSQTNRHADHVVAAARAGKDVLLQKPMALTLDDCDRIITAVGEHGIRFSMCYQMRVDPVNREIRRLVHSGAVGKVAMVRRRHAIPLLLDPGFARPGNWHIDPAQNMGMFMDDASHAADWFLWLLGPPVSVLAEIDNVVTDIAPDDNGVAVFRFSRKEIGVLLNSSTMLAAEATTEVYGDEGVIVHNYGDLPSSFLPRPPGAAGGVFTYDAALRLFRKGDAAWQISASRPTPRTAAGSRRSPDRSSTTCTEGAARWPPPRKAEPASR